MEDKRDKLHNEALEYFEKNNFKTLFSLATGTGKSVLTIKIINKYPGKYLLVTPTILLHKKNWKTEFEKHSSIEIYNKLDRCCYRSLYKYDLNNYDGIILDEAHRLSVRQYNLLRKYLPLLKQTGLYSKKVIALTATPGKKGFTQRVLKEIINNNVFDCDINEAVNDKFVNDFRIHIIYTELDSVNKNCLAGSKEKPFYTTEKLNYEYITSCINNLKEEMNTTSGKIKYLSKYQMYILKRTRMLYNLESKINKVQEFLKKLNKEEKTIIFAKTINIAERLEKNSVHSESKEDFISSFIEGKINRISSVDMLLEGFNLEKVVNGVITNPFNERKFIQSLGRIVRNDIDKISNYYIFCTKNTVEEEWLNNSINDIDKSKIIIHE